MTHDIVALRRLEGPAAPGHEPQQQLCASESPAASFVPALLAAAAPAAARCGSASPAVQLQLQVRSRSVSPGRSARPITPDPTPAHASATPARRHQAVHAAGSAAAAAADARRGPAKSAAPRSVVAGAGGAAGGGDLPTWRRVHSFVCCVVESPLLQSALASLLLGGRSDDPEADPGTDGSVLPPGPNLRLTMAQMLALFLRAGYETASADVLLAVLWVLESWGSAWRSPASTCLAAYLKHLALFSPELVVQLTADWPTSFKRLRAAVVAAQKDLLARLEWRVRLDLHTDVRPCHHWLFPATASWCQLLASLATGASQHSAPPGGACQPLKAPPAIAWGAWASHMHGLCAHIERQVLLAAPACPSTAGAQGEALACHTRYPKRQRTQL